MKDRKKLLAAVVMTVLTAWGIHQVQEFRFCNLEGVNLFLYDTDHILAVLSGHGGLALLVSSFLTQFMRVPFLGAAIAAALYVLTGWMTGRILGKINGGSAMDGLAFLPVAFMFLCLENDYYMFHGHIALAMSVAALLAYASLPQDRPSLRYAAALAAAPLLYFLVGSAALVYAAGVLVLEILRNGLRGLRAVSCPAVMILTAAAFVRLSVASGWDTALTPFMYYSHPSTYFFPVYAWCSLPLLMVVAWAASRITLKPSHSMIVAGAGLALSFFVAWNLYGKVHSRSHYRLLSEQYMAEAGDWDGIIRTADRSQPTFFVSYLNLALARKDMLTKNFMHYRPQTLSSLMYPTPNLRAGFSMQSMVYGSWGYHAAARQAAFDANMVTPGMHNPRQLKVLVETNMALGDDEVALKYISILEKTLFYRKWAEARRDAIGGPSSAFLPHTDGYVRYDGIKGDMRDILEADPSQRILAQFYELYQILEKEEVI